MLANIATDQREEEFDDISRCQAARSVSFIVVGDRVKAARSILRQCAQSGSVGFGGIEGIWALFFYRQRYNGGIVSRFDFAQFFQRSQRIEACILPQDV